VIYGEGLYIGYRHYERLNIQPLFPFGHGLSYTTFSYGKPSISSDILADSSQITITLPVTNSGGVAGAEIVQAYIHDKESSLPRPEKELQAFAKVFLQPGETKDVTLNLDKYSVGYYDTNRTAWIAEQGVFDVLIGASSQDIRYVEERFGFLHAIEANSFAAGTLFHSRLRNHSRGYFKGYFVARRDSHTRIYTAAAPHSSIFVGIRFRCLIVYLFNLAPFSGWIQYRT
jgi:hypothetical protein